MRKITNLNDNWSFSKDRISWEEVSLPHTWNAVDGMDGRGEYYRGICYYRRQLQTPSLQEGERVYLEILALSLCGTVYVNDREIGSHEGGFSSFAVDITDALIPSPGKAAAPETSFGDTAPLNTVTILADNSPHSNIYPQMADFTFYGGLYRGVNLLILPEHHFQADYHGAQGLAVTPEILDSASLPTDSRLESHNVEKGVYPSCGDTPGEPQYAMLHLNSWISSPSPDYTICYRITDAAGADVAEAWRPSGEPKADVLLPRPHLWQGVEDPYLYACTATLVYRNEAVDEVTTRFGVRSFHVDPDKGFFLNGRPMMLRGVSRHQDRLYLGNALTRQQHYEDAALIKEIGANTVRLAHYQHSPDFYDACDEYGFIVWAEIPYISCQSDDPAAHDNCVLQMKDLIYQNYNHPSICFWGISNEITIAGEKPGLVENHKALNALVKKLDPSRLTTIAHVSMLPLESPLHGITDVESYNHYFGWYGGSYEYNEKWLDHFHEACPDICLGLSEYGAEGIITYQPDTPKCRDYSESYQAEYHEHMAKILMERPWLWSTHVWNMFDFGCAARNEGGTAGRNNKGLVTMDRKIKKEAFYLYKAYWSSEPFVHICGRRYAQREGETARVKVYSNLSQVTLYVNGRPFATQYGDKIFVFENVPLTESFTYLTAEAGSHPCTGQNLAAPGHWTSCYRQPQSQNCTLRCTDTVTLELVEEKPEIYTLPDEDGGSDGVANWFEQVETVASDAPMEYSDQYFSVHDKINTIAASDEAFAVLSNALYAMTGMRMKKSMLAMMGEKTFAELSGLMGAMGGADTGDGVSGENADASGTNAGTPASGTGASGGRKIPANALQIINAELNKIRK